ncbi:MULTISPECIES: hypothetical protein [Chroococcidiopsis]|uniref:hypothetical protein n=1 Tax=Chroococcidiopsis TaxID=54298 RepID=UPI0002EFBC8D|nr:MULTISPECIES: hypothetical protein [Chroococcidiopsis]MBE9015917.1 hypothetical protein [Chroococcidiopsidales cyanobacterium LEGE 13417]URD50050.1 hypothetical protein M5J74_27585 [Chroococcidiopsis sp. CCNUC1]
MVPLIDLSPSDATKNQYGLYQPLLPAVHSSSRPICLLRSESDRGVTCSFILSLEMKDEKQ